MSVGSEPLAVAMRVAVALERLGIPYAIGGSLASMIHGEPRATLDVDFAVQMTPEEARQLATALERDFHVQPDALIDAARRWGMANVVHRSPYLKVDFHVGPASGHHQEELRRAVRVQVGTEDSETLRVAAPEDIVLQKLRWYRLSGGVSERQWRDVSGVIKRQGERLDRAHLERWAHELGVTDLLMRAFRESGIG